MNQYKRIGIDTSKAVFTLHGIDQQDRPVLRINLRRAQLIPFFTKLPPTEIAMEACSGAHYWARELIALGHVVRLIPPQYVKPYVKRGKNDRNDAEAICEAAGRPGMHFVLAKSVTQQAQGMVLKVRESLVGQRTMLINTLHGHAAEFGVIACKGPAKVGPLLTAIEQETTIPPEAKDMAILLGQQIANLDARIKEIEVKLTAAHKANAVSQRLATIPGVGPVTALTLAIEIDPAAFESGRHLAAWAGLTPTEHSTGGSSGWAGSVERTMNECAFCPAAGQPGMHFVPAKSVTLQAQGMVLKVRESLVGRRTLLINTLRGHAAEFGVIAGKGPAKVGPLLTAIAQETTIPPEAKDMAILLGQQIADLDARIKDIEVKLTAAHKANAVSQRLATIPGVGPVTALTLAIEIDPAAFESGRHLAAWPGLTPTEHSTGGKQRMGGISRAGNERLRVLLVTGATSVINAAKKPGSKLMTEWLRALLLRKPRKVVAVALANKMARVAWALMTRGEVYRHAATTTGAAVA